MIEFHAIIEDVEDGRDEAGSPPVMGFGLSLKSDGIVPGGPGAVDRVVSLKGRRVKVTVEQWGPALARLEEVILDGGPHANTETLVFPGDSECRIGTQVVLGRIVPPSAYRATDRRAALRSWGEERRVFEYVAAPGVDSLETASFSTKARMTDPGGIAMSGQFKPKSPDRSEASIRWDTMVGSGASPYGLPAGCEIETGGPWPPSEPPEAETWRDRPPML